MYTGLYQLNATLGVCVCVSVELCESRLNLGFCYYKLYTGFRYSNFFFPIPALKIACQLELWHGVLQPRVIGNYKTQLQRVHCFQCREEEKSLCTILINIFFDIFIYFFACVLSLSAQLQTEAGIKTHTKATV